MEIYREEYHATLEVESGVLCLQTKECQGLQQPAKASNKQRILSQRLLGGPTNPDFELLISTIVKE
jgi:hypothetical protein